MQSIINKLENKAKFLRDHNFHAQAITTENVKEYLEKQGIEKTRIAVSTEFSKLNYVLETQLYTVMQEINNILN